MIARLAWVGRGFACLKGKENTNMTVKAICLTHKTPISIRGIEYMADNCDIMVIEEPKKGDKA